MTSSTRTFLLFVFLGIASCSYLRAQGYEFSYFDCVPSSCVEKGPAEINGSVTVVFGSDCTGGIIDGINFSVSSVISNCRTPYVPYASMTIRSVSFPADTCPPSVYWVDYVTATSEIFTAGGVPYYYQDLTLGCDGSKSGPTVFGSKPC